MKKFISTILLILLSGIIHPAWSREDGSPPGWFLGQVTIKGAQQISHHEIIEVMENRASSWFSLTSAPRFDRTSPERDQLRIWQFYRENGFFNVSVKVIAQEREDQHKVDLLVEIEEGAQFKISAVELILPETVDEKWRDQIMEIIALRYGQPASLELYGNSKENIRKFLANHAHPLCQLQGQLLVYNDINEATARFMVAAGPTVRFGPARLLGQGQVDHQFITDRLSFVEGQPFCEDELKRTQERLFVSGLFGSVTLSPLFDQMENDQVPINIDCEEAAPHALSLGLGWGTEDQFRLQIYQVNRNLFKMNDTLTIEGKYSAIYTGITSLWHVPGQYISFDLRGGLRQTDNEAYDDRSLFINPVFNFHFLQPWRLSLGFNAQLFNMRELKTSISDPGYYDKSHWINTVGMTISYDSRDSNLNPTKGTMINLGINLSSPSLGSEAAFVQPTASISNIIPLGWEQWALAWRAKASITLPTEDSERMPLYCRFFPGGSQSVRGFRYQSLGPLDSNSRPLGGEIMVEGSVELRFPLVGDLNGVLFVDTGNAYESYYDISGGLRYTCGVGLRYHTPLGPVRLDFGYILNPPQNYDYNYYQVYLSVGQAF